MTELNFNQVGITPTRVEYSTSHTMYLKSGWDHAYEIRDTAYNCVVPTPLRLGPAIHTASLDGFFEASQLLA